MQACDHDVVIIGAGPAGAVAAGLLRRLGRSVLVLEREEFPRFSIGESLLPQSMRFLEQAGMLRAVVEEGFQFKNGAAFACGALSASIDFRDKYTAGWGTTYQVQRARFDQVLAEAAARMGADVRYRHEVIACTPDADGPLLQVQPASGAPYAVRGRFVLDASGFGRVLSRLLALETPSDFPVRSSIFAHVEDRAEVSDFDRNKILITVHPAQSDVWYWTIPFSNGRASVGVVARRELLAGAAGEEMARLRHWVEDAPTLARVLRNAVWDGAARQVTGYAANVKALCGPGYALLGNAAEFLDPVFSSGVTIALKSAALASAAVDRALTGERVHWEQDYAVALRKGVDTFRAFVHAWYDGSLQRIIFHERQSAEVRRMIAAVLAGYAWDERNPFVAEPGHRIAVLAQLCGG